MDARQNPVEQPPNGVLNNLNEELMSSNVQHEPLPLPSKNSKNLSRIERKRTGSREDRRSYREMRNEKNRLHSREYYYRNAERIREMSKLGMRRKRAKSQVLMPLRDCKVVLEKLELPFSADGSYNLGTLSVRYNWIRSQERVKENKSQLGMGEESLHERVKLHRRECNKNNEESTENQDRKNDSKQMTRTITETNRDKRKECRRRYRAENREKIREYRKRYYLEVEKKRTQPMGLNGNAFTQLKDCAVIIEKRKSRSCLNEDAQNNDKSALHESSVQSQEEPNTVEKNSSDLNETNLTEKQRLWEKHLCETREKLIQRHKRYWRSIQNNKKKTLQETAVKKTKDCSSSETFEFCCALGKSQPWCEQRRQLYQTKRRKFLTKIRKCEIIEPGSTQSERLENRQSYLQNIFVEVEKMLDPGDAANANQF